MKFEIGKVFTGENLPEKEGPVLEFTRDRLGLVLKLNGVSEQEVRAFQAGGDFELALYEQDSVIFLLLQVGSLIEWSDAPYSVVTFGRDSWPMTDSGATLKLIALLVEGKDKKVKAAREITLDRAFSEKLLGLVEAQKKAAISVEEYLARIAKIQKRLTPAMMVKKAATQMRT